MYGGYYGGWLPKDYLTQEIPLDVYENRTIDPTWISKTGRTEITR